LIRKYSAGQYTSDIGLADVDENVIFGFRLKRKTSRHIQIGPRRADAAVDYAPRRLLEREHGGIPAADVDVAPYAELRAD
jgi:hypothetical protein